MQVSIKLPLTFYRDVWPRVTLNNVNLSTQLSIKLAGNNKVLSICLFIRPWNYCDCWENPKESSKCRKKRKNYVTITTNYKIFTTFIYYQAEKHKKVEEKPDRQKRKTFFLFGKIRWKWCHLAGILFVTIFLLFSIFFHWKNSK